LFKQNAKFVANFLFRLGVRGADLDDAVQEVFLAAHRRGGYRPGAASPTTFLARLALEANHQRRRQEGRWQGPRRDAAAHAAIGQPAADPGQALAEKNAALRLQAALDTMDPAHRAVFILFELEGESCGSISAGLDVPIGTVHSRLYAARRAFRDAVQGGSAGDEGPPPRRVQENEMRPPLAAARVSGS
jgi:RNA polymerase sigma-70 factor (ECF subfamily)